MQQFWFWDVTVVTKRCVVLIPGCLKITNKVWHNIWTVPYLELLFGLKIILTVLITGISIGVTFYNNLLQITLTAVMGYVDIEWLYCCLFELDQSILNPIPSSIHKLMNLIRTVNLLCYFGPGKPLPNHTPSCLVFPFFLLYTINATPIFIPTQV